MNGLLENISAKFLCKPKNFNIDEFYVSVELKNTVKNKRCFSPKMAVKFT